MSEVKRYHLTEAGLVEGVALGRLNVVLAAEYEAAVEEIAKLKQLNALEQETVTLALNTSTQIVAERDELQRLLDHKEQQRESELRNGQAGDRLVGELQERLTAADELADVLYGTCVERDGLLREWLNDFGRTHSGLLRLRKRTRAALKPAEGGGDAARLALRPENQRITPARFKCLACGEYHEGSGNLPCPSMSPYSRIEQ